MKELARVVIDALIDEREWTFNEAAAQLEAAGLRLLYAATTLRWQLDRTFGPGPLPDTLLGPLDQMEPEALSRLIDALDPASLDKDYVLYACRARYEPVVPSWPRTRSNDDSSFDHLIPHLTGLGRPEKGLPATSAAQGRTLYRTVSGAIGELERIAVLRLAAVDGQSSCGDIDRKLASHTRASDDTLLRQECWVNLADSGLIVFEPPRIGLH